MWRTGRYVELGGGGGGKERALTMVPTDDRTVLEQVVGAAMLDRLNGYPVGSLAESFKRQGGTNETVIAVLEEAFGGDFDLHLSQGLQHLKERLVPALTKTLVAEGLTFPTTKAFRDMQFHFSGDKIAFKAIVKDLLEQTRQAKPEAEKGELGGGPP